MPDGVALDLHLIIVVVFKNLELEGVVAEYNRAHLRLKLGCALTRHQLRRRAPKYISAHFLHDALECVTLLCASLVCCSFDRACMVMAMSWHNPIDGALPCRHRAHSAGAVRLACMMGVMLKSMYFSTYAWFCLSMGLCRPATTT